MHVVQVFIVSNRTTIENSGGWTPPKIMFHIFRKVLLNGCLKVSGFAALPTCLLTGPATLNAADRIAVYTEQDYPLNYTESGEDDDPALGSATELVIVVLEEAGLEYEITVVPWVRAMMAIDAEKNVLVYSMIRNADREDKYHWIGEVIQADFCLYGLRSGLTSIPRSLEEAREFSVGIPRGYTHHDELAKLGFSQLVAVNNFDQLMRMLIRGRVDLVVFSKEVMPVSERYGFKEDDLIGLVRLDGLSASLQIALSKRSNDEIVRRLQHAYESVRASGMYERIMGPLMSDRKECGIDGQP